MHFLLYVEETFESLKFILHIWGFYFLLSEN